MLFRWSLWGEKRGKCEMLQQSIGTFRACFGSFARYVVYTDEPQSVSAFLNGAAEIHGYDEHPAPLFNFNSNATWRKWSPAVRLTESETEVYVDSDVFIVGEPDEIRRFCIGLPGNRFLALQESIGARWCLGRLEPRVPTDAPFINAGLIGQQPQANLTDELIVQYDWWRTNVPSDAATFHDEQGAIVAALTPHIITGRVDLLPTDRYRIISPRSNWHLKNLEGVALIHTTHPDHPAFQRFRTHISKYSNVDYKPDGED